MTSGLITYDISVVFPKDSPENKNFSRDLYKQILENNIPSNRKVYFDGTKSKTEETTVDYGYKSLTKIIRGASNEGYLYCKEFPYFNFCIPFPAEMSSSSEYALPQVTLFEEYKKILGYKCQKAKIEDASLLYFVWFTKEIQIKDPTNAVIQHKNIDGLVLEQEEIPVGPKVYFYKRYVVHSIKFMPIKPETFDSPLAYRKFQNIDEVRLENMKMLDEAYQKELSTDPLIESEKNIFNGAWLYNNGEDSILIYIKPVGLTEQSGNSYSFISVILTDKSENKQLPKTEEASLKGRKLLVEEPPNYRLYSYDSKTDQMELEQNNIFKYKRLIKEDFKAIKEKYKIDFMR